MKTHEKRAIVYLLVLMLCVASNLQATVIMHLDSVATGPNQTAVFSLHISNDTPFVGFQLDVNYPAVLTYINNSTQLTSRATDHVLSASVVSSGVLRIIVYSVSLSRFSGTSGAVATISFRSGTLPGSFPLVIQNASIVDSAGHNILTGSYGGLFTLNAPQLDISPQDLNFGSVPLYQNAIRTITLKNTGNVDLHISRLSTGQSTFQVSDSTALVIPAGGSTTRNIIFFSSKKGMYNDELTVSSDDPSSTKRQVGLTGIAFAVNELRLGSVNGRSGYIFHLPVSINNMEKFTGFQFKLFLPSVAKFISGSAHLSTRALDHVVAADTSGGVLTVVAYSPSNQTFRDTNGTVLTIDLMVRGQGGSYLLSPTNAVISDSAATNIMSASYPGNIQVVSPMLSLSSTSINYGSVSARDTASATLIISNTGSDTLFINSLSINNPSFYTSTVAPLVIPPWNSKNLLILFHSVLEGAQSGQLVIRSNDLQHDPAFVALSANVFFPNVLSIQNGFGFKNEGGFILIRIDNMKSITGFQCDVSLPSPISAQPGSIQLTSRKKDHVISASTLSSGVLRIIAYSPSLATFSSDTGVVAVLPVTFSDTMGTFQVHLSNVVLSDTLGNNVLTGTKDGYYQIRSRKITITENVNKSWNIVSVPVIADNFLASNLFQGATSKAFYFTNKYVASDTLQNKYGYWLKFGSPTAVNIVGLPIVADTFSLQAGWNLIGSISASVSVDSIIVSPAGNISSFYFGFNGGYRISDSLCPGNGYWVKVFKPGKLILQTNPDRIYQTAKAVFFNGIKNRSMLLTLQPIHGEATYSSLDTLNFLEVTNADSFSQKLYFGRTNIDSTGLLKYELPPKPPYDAFDVRFSSGRFLEPLPQKFDSTDLNVEVQTSRYPLNVSWHIVQNGISYYIIENLMSGIRRTRIIGDGSINISDTTEKSFTVRCVSTIVGVNEARNKVPTGVNLEQNYPNPFNPSTIIRFDLPEAQTIELTIYDISGRKIKTLAIGKYPSGSHEVTFDASNLSSGVYIARLITERETVSKKIVLIR